MSSPDVRSALLEVVPFGRLSVLAHRLAGWRGIPINVIPLSPQIARVYDGRTDGRIRVWFAPRAPVHTVAHELAHVVSGDRSHGPEWERSFVDLCRDLLTAMR